MARPSARTAAAQVVASSRRRGRSPAGQGGDGRCVGHGSVLVVRGETECATASLFEAVEQAITHPAQRAVASLPWAWILRSGACRGTSGRESQSPERTISSVFGSSRRTISCGPHPRDHRMAGGGALAERDEAVRRPLHGAIVASLDGEVAARRARAGAMILSMARCLRFGSTALVAGRCFRPPPAWRSDCFSARASSAGQSPRKT